MGRHLTRGELMLFLTRKRPTRDDVDDLLEHLFEECDECKAVLENVVLRVDEKPQSLEALPRSVEAVWRRFRLIATAEVDELLPHSPQERHLKINRARTRFRNPILVDRLLDASKQRITSDPHDAYDLAECARDVAMRLSHVEVGGRFALTCLARANAYRANALRVLGHLKQAERILEGALALFDAEGTGHPLVQAEFMELSASLARAQRRLIEAEGFLDMARTLYEDCKEPLLQARVLMMQGTVFSEAGEPEKALAAVTKALASIDRSKDPWLYLYAVHNSADYLVELGRYERAAEVIREHRSLYEEYATDWINIRRLWIEAKIARMRGERSTSETLFLTVREQFTSVGSGYDAALVGLDLALLYVEDGRTQNVIRLAEEMVPVFMAEDIHREAAAAVMLFQEAARKEAVTASMIAELISYLRRVRAGANEDVA